MKFFHAFLAIAASLVLIEAQTFTRPDAALAALTEFEEKIAAYQDEMWTEIRALRASTGENVEAAYIEGITIGAEKIAKIGSSDTEIRAAIDSKTPNLCWTSAARDVDEAITFAGFDFSNCIDIPENFANLLPENADLDTLEREVNTLPQVIVDGVYGRNIFLESAAIIARVQELLDAKKANIESIIKSVKESTILSSEWERIKESLVTCFEATEASVAAAYEDITNRKFPVCEKYVVRGSRSGIPVIHIEDFFNNRH